MFLIVLQYDTHNIFRFLKFWLLISYTEISFINKKHFWGIYIFWIEVI